MIRKDVDDFFNNWNEETDLNIAIVDQHMVTIKYNYWDNHGVSKKILRQKNMMEYCYLQYKDKFLKPNISKDEMMDEHLKYISNRKKSGVIAITEDKKLLLVRSRQYLDRGRQ